MAGSIFIGQMYNFRMNPDSIGGPARVVSLDVARGIEVQFEDGSPVWVKSHQIVGPWDEEAEKLEHERFEELCQELQDWANRRQDG
jgi:hypothetical protein